jgi:aminomethyltransferase
MIRRYLSVVKMIQFYMLSSLHRDFVVSPNLSDYTPLPMLKTPFHQYQLDHNGKMVDFAGWEMPILFESIHGEHHHTRNSASLFDVSHMGRIKITGRHARRLLELILTRRISDMAEKTCRYSLICNEAGGVLDDVLIYRYRDYWLIVVNASNREKILDHIHANIGDWVVKIEDITEKTGMVALQGPMVMELLGKFSREVPTLKRYTFTVKNLLVLEMTISRTGYTGEDGVEIIMGATMANMALKLLAKESPDGDPEKSVRPAGLGARDTLRMEAGMPLYGHELDESLDPISAGLGFAVSLDKDQDERGESFIGIEALQHISAAGPTRKLVGLKLSGKRTPRQGMVVQNDDIEIGQVTSGCVSPTLGYPIAMAYIDANKSALGTAVKLDVGDAEIVTLPFYKRP